MVIAIVADDHVMLSLLTSTLLIKKPAGKTYRLADDFARRCLNQALFKKIHVHDDLTLEADYAEPFDTILNSGILELRQEYRNFCVLGSITIQTPDFFMVRGLSLDILVRASAPYLNNYIEPALIERNRIVNVITADPLNSLNNVFGLRECKIT